MSSDHSNWLKAQRRREREARKVAVAKKEREIAVAFARSNEGVEIPDLPIIEVVRKRAPRVLGEPVYVQALRDLNDRQASWVRSLDDWRPKGKSVDTVFRSLASHLLARYKMPDFLWSAFTYTEPDPAHVHATQLESLVVHLAAGGSLMSVVPSKIVPPPVAPTIEVPLTRKMAHIFMTTTAGIGIVSALRRAQILGSGGSPALWLAWRDTRAWPLQSLSWENFWQSVIEWFCRNPMLPTAQVGPLLDYFHHRRNRDTSFGMKGRSVLASLRAMEEWHRELAHTKVGAREPKVFRPSGFVGYDLDRSHRDRMGKHHKQIWHVREILTRAALVEEGRAMHHCVYSYASVIAAGDTSIWVVTEEDGTGHWRRLTIEVRKSGRSIIQVRGPCNRMPESRELQVVREWSAKNGLTDNRYGGYAPMIVGGR